MNATANEACEICGEIHEDEGPPDTWPAWTDAIAFTPAIPEDGEGRGGCGILSTTDGTATTLADLADEEAGSYAATGTAEGAYLAGLMRDLAARIRQTGATTAAEFIELDREHGRRA